MPIILGSKLAAPFKNKKDFICTINGMEVLFNVNFDIEKELSNNMTLELSEVTDINQQNIYFPRFSHCKLFYKTQLIFEGLVEDTERGHFETFRRNHIDRVTVLHWRKWLDYMRISISIIEDTALEIISNQILIDLLNENRFKFEENPDFTNKKIKLKGYGLEFAPISDLLDFICEVTNSLWFIEYDDESDFYIIKFINKLKKPYKTITVENLLKTGEIEGLIWENKNLEYSNSLILSSDSIESDELNIEIFTLKDSKSHETQFKISKIKRIYERLNVVGADYIIKERTFANNLQRDNGVVADFYYRIDGRQLEINDELFKETGLAGRTWIVEYWPRINADINFTNSDEFDRLQKDFRIKAPWVTVDKRIKYLNNLESVKNFVNNYFLTYSKPHIDITIRSKSKVPLFQLGERINFKVQNNLKWQKLLSVGNRTSEFIVKKISEEHLTGNYWHKSNDYIVTRTYELTNILSSYDYINYFDKRTINPYLNLIDEGVVLSLKNVFEKGNLIFEVESAD